MGKRGREGPVNWREQPSGPALAQWGPGERSASVLHPSPDAPKHLRLVSCQLVAFLFFPVCKLILFLYCHGDSSGVGGGVLCALLNAGFFFLEFAVWTKKKNL